MNKLDQIVQENNLKLDYQPMSKDQALAFITITFANKSNNINRSIFKYTKNKLIKSNRFWRSNTRKSRNSSWFCNRNSNRPIHIWKYIKRSNRKRWIYLTISNLGCNNSWKWFNNDKKVLYRFYRWFMVWRFWKITKWKICSNKWRRKKNF